MCKAAYDRQVTDTHINDICLHCSFKWANLLAPLGMNSNVEDDLDQMQGLDKSDRFLRIWKQQKGDGATYKVLMAALLSINCQDDADYICRLLEGSDSIISAPSSDGVGPSPPEEDEPDMILPSDMMSPSARRQETLTCVYQLLKRGASTSSENPDKLGPSPPEEDEPDMTSPSARRQSMEGVQPLQSVVVFSPQRESINIIFAGGGKKTLFENLFSLKMDGKIFSLPKEGKTMNVCLFGCEDSIDDLQTFKQERGSPDLLVYCMLVNQGTKFIHQNPEIMESLDTVFSKDIWRRCIVVATCSNLAWDHTHLPDLFDNPDAAYRANLQNYSTLFGRELSKLQVHCSTVCPRTIFSYAVNGNGRSSDEKTIPVIPAGRTSRDFVMCSGVRLHGGGWVDEVLHEMLNKCGDDACKNVLKLFGQQLN